MSPRALQPPSWHKVRPPTAVTFLRNLVKISQFESYKSGAAHSVRLLTDSLLISKRVSPLWKDMTLNILTGFYR